MLPPELFRKILSLKLERDGDAHPAEVELTARIFAKVGKRSARGVLNALL